MMTDRRKFLQSLAAVSAGTMILEGKTIAALPANINTWPQFVKDNKGKYPCALVIEFTYLYHRQFQSLAESKSRAVQALFSHVPVILLERTHLTQNFKACPNSNIFFVSLDGKVLKKGKLNMADLKDSRKLTKSLAEFYYSDNVLKKSWETFSPLKNSAAEKVKENITVLDTGSYRERKAAKIEISRNIRQNLWLLSYYAINSKSIEQRESCRDLLITYRNKAPLVNGLPQPAISSRVNVRCGMASMTDESRLFITSI